MTTTDPAAATWHTTRQRMCDRYFNLLAEADSPLLHAGEQVREQLTAQMLSIADEAAGFAPADATLSEDIGRSRAASGVHPSASLAAANLIFAACFADLADHLRLAGLASPVEAAALRLNRAILARMAAAAANYVSYLLEKAGTAHREEAMRLGRELHDTVGPVIAVGLQNLDLIEYWTPIDPGKAAEKVDAGRRTLREAMTLVRTLAAETRLAVEPHQICDALTAFLQSLPPTIATSLTAHSSLAELAPHYGNEIFLVLREAARNAGVHADATEVSIDIAIEGTTLIGTVRDNGRGFDPSQEPPGTGRTSMAERAALIGARLDITSTESGTTVRLAVPLPGRPAA